MIKDTMTKMQSWTLMGTIALGVLAPVRAAALPALPPLDPLYVMSLQSINSDTPTQILFRNALDHGVNVIWIDYSGNEVFYVFLDVGESYTQGTYVTHPWLVRSAVTLAPIVGFLPDAQLAEAVIVQYTSTVPEPMTVLLLGAGLAGVGAVSRRRRTRSPELRPATGPKPA
jgi:hypothetical protein